MTDDRLNDDIGARHRKELLWTDDDQRRAYAEMQREDDRLKALDADADLAEVDEPSRGYHALAKALS